MQKLRMTNVGQALVTKLIAGTSEINFTKMKTSDHVYQASDIAELTELDDVRQTVSVSSATIVSGTVVRVRATVNNTGATTGYWVKAVGLYAMDEAEEEEILFGVSLCDDAADYIPPQTVTTTGITYTVNCRVGNTEYVDVTVDPAAVVAMEDFEELTEYVIDVENALVEHKNGSMMQEEGQHGVRYYGNMLQYYDEGRWKPMELCGYRLAVWVEEPDAMVTATCTYRNNVLTLRQKAIGGLAYFMLPMSGTWEVTAEKEGFSFEVVSMSVNASYNYERYVITLNVVLNNKIYGFRIDLNNPDPDMAVTYTDDAVGITPGSEWDNEDIFRRIRPVLYNSSYGSSQRVRGYLNPNNYAEFTDGTPADITSGESGDVMIDFPVMYIKTTKENNIVEVKISLKEQSGYTKSSRRLVSAYLMSDINGTKMSLSGKTPYETSPGSTISNEMDFYTLSILRNLFILRYKSLNSRVHLGQGYLGKISVDENDKYTVTKATTGGANNKGMYYASNSTEQNKFCGLEDIYGNCPIYVGNMRVARYTVDSVAQLSYRTNNATSMSDTARVDKFSSIGGSGTSSSPEYGVNVPDGRYYLQNISNFYRAAGFLPYGLASEQNGSASTYFCNPVEISSLPAATSGTSYKYSSSSSYYNMYFGMMLCDNPDDPEGNKILDDTVGMFSMQFEFNASDLPFAAVGHRRVILPS